MAPPLLTRHPLDYALIPFFAISVLYGALFSLPEGLGLPVTPDSPWPPLRALHGWAVVQEPTHLDPPRTLIASTLFDGFVQTPLLVALIAGLLRRRAWARPLGLLYAGAGVINMWFYFFETLSGPLPPPHLSVYLPFNLPWLIAPAVLGWRLWPRRKWRSERAEDASRPEPLCQVSHASHFSLATRALSCKATCSGGATHEMAIGD